MRLNQIRFEEHPLFGSQSVDLKGLRIFGICGKNGVGKTTFLESIGFRMRPAAFGGGVERERKPFLNSVIDFNEGSPFRASRIPGFRFFINFSIDQTDFPLLLKYRAASFSEEQLADYELLQSDSFSPGDYEIIFENELVPRDGFMSFMPVMHKRGDGATCYAWVGDLDKFFYCIDVDPIAFYDLVDWGTWSQKNIPSLALLSSKVSSLGGVKLPDFVLPVINFLVNFRSAWEAVLPVLLDPNLDSQKKKFSISGLQDAFLRELSKGQLRVLLTLVEIEKFNRSDACFLAIEEPEQNFDPIAQKFLISFYESLIKPGAQIFFTTHSPYLLSYFAGRLSDDSIDRLFVFRAEDGFVRILSCSNEVESIDALPQVFDIFSEDVFIKLYARVLASFLPSVSKGAGRRLGDIIKEKLPEIEMKWDPHDGLVPLPIYIRNAIHHPEATERSYSDFDLKYSVEKLMQFLSSNP